MSDTRLGEWQKCPVCNGAGSVSGGYFVRVGDCDTWVSGNAMETCQVCSGSRIIQKPVAEKEIPPNPVEKKI